MEDAALMGLFTRHLKYLLDSQLMTNRTICVNLSERTYHLNSIASYLVFDVQKNIVKIVR